MKKQLLPITAVLALTAIFQSCKKDDATPGIPVYTVPATYDFENVEYSEATAKVNMWSGYTAYLSKGTTRKLSQDTISYLWSNTNTAFTAEVVVNLPNTHILLNSSTFNLAAQSADASTLKSYADSMAIVSASFATAASEGVAGKIGTRIFNYTGMEFNQLVAKGLMGSLQMTTIISLLNKVATDDNSTVNTGTGTAMQHDWDMAFGYTSIPKNYDSSITYASTVVDRPLAIGGYFRERGRHIKAGGTVFEAFRKGRAAINAKDYTTRDEAIKIIKDYLEKTIAAACYEYSGIGMTAADLAGKFHGMSEGYGFATALKYRQPGSKLSDADYQTLLGIFQTSFYVLNADASGAKLKQAQAILTAAYGQLQP